MRKLISFAFALASFSASAFPADRHIAFERNQPAIEKLDITSEKAVRVTGRNDFVWDLFWLRNNEFLCILQKENENEPSIYRMSLHGKNAKLLVNMRELRA